MISDEEIVKAFSVSDNEGYRKLMDAYGNYVYTIITDRVKGLASEYDMEECMADIFIETVKECKAYGFSMKSLKAVLITVSKRRATDLLRKLSTRNKYNESLDEITEEPVENVTPESVTSDRSEKEELWNEVMKLGEPDSQIIILQYFYSKPVREIAEFLKMTAAAVNKRSLRAREKLKKILMEKEAV